MDDGARFAGWCVATMAALVSAAFLAWVAGIPALMQTETSTGFAHVTVTTTEGIARPARASAPEPEPLHPELAERDEQNRRLLRLTVATLLLDGADPDRVLELVREKAGE